MIRTITDQKGITCTCTDTDAIQKYMNYVDTHPALKKANLVQFVINSDSTVQVRYTITTTLADYDSEMGLDLCYLGWRFSHASSHLYYAPGSTRVFIPVVDYKVFMQEALSRTCKLGNLFIPTRSISNFVQNMKLGYGDGFQLLNELLEYNSFNRPSTLGRLLYEVTPSAVQFTEDKFNAFMSYSSKILLELMELFNAAMSTLDVKVPSVLNTLILVTKSTSHVFETEAWNKAKYMTDTKKYPLIEELSTDVVFNPTSREFLDKLIDYSTKDGFVKDYYVKRDYTAVKRLMNAQDFMPPYFRDFTSIDDDTSVSPDLEFTYYNSGSKLSKRILTAKRLVTAVDVLKKSAPSNDAVISTLDKIVVDDESLLDPSMLVLTDRLLINLKNIFKIMEKR